MDQSKVIVGISPSFAGLAAVRFAVAEARRREAPLFAVRAWRLRTGSRSRAMRVWETSMAAEAADLVAATFRQACGAVPSLPALVVRTPNADPATALVDAVSQPGDLLVLGASTRRLGSIPRACVRGAACPVIVVPAPEMARLSRRAARSLTRETAEALTTL
jgi:nucleotide-binding universal stress UspA family protein